MKITPEQATAKWVNRLQQATEEVRRGVEQVTQAPGQIAASKFQKWITGVQESQQKWRRNVAAVSLDEWKTSMINVGIPRIAQGAQQKQGKMQRFLDQFFPHLERGVAAVKAMPDTTFEERIARANAMMRHNHEFRRGGVG